MIAEHELTFWRIAIAASEASFPIPLSRPFTIISLRAFRDCIVLISSKIVRDFSAESKFWKSKQVSRKFLCKIRINKINQQCWIKTSSALNYRMTKHQGWIYRSTKDFIIRDINSNRKDPNICSMTVIQWMYKVQA